MQATTGTVTAALAADESTVNVRVQVDWNRNGSYTDTYDDLSLYVDEQSVERAISSDIPDAAQVLTGRSDGSADLTLSGAEVVSIFSPYTSTLSSVARMGAPCRIDLAVTTTAGVEYVPLLRGRITRVTVNADEGTVGLQVIDQWEAVTKAVQLPTVVADDKGFVRGGLSASWVMDWLLRQNGFYCTPPLRSQVIAAATFHGAAQPEVGTCVGATFNDTDAGSLSIVGPVTYRDGTMGPRALSLRWVGSLIDEVDLRPVASYTIDSGANLYVEGWWLCDGTGSFVMLDSLGLAAPNSSLLIGVTGPSVSVEIRRSSFAGSSTAGAVTAGWHYIAVHVAFTATGANVNVRVDGTTSTTTVTVTGGPATGNGDFTHCVVGGAGAVGGTPAPAAAVEGYQVTTEAFSAAMWNNAYARSAVLEPSLNELTATPATDTTDSRDLLQAIAAAEAGIVTFDEAGVFRFYNRNHLAGTTTAATLTSTRDLLSIGTTEALDSVRNVVSVTARPLTAQNTDSTVWALSEATAVPARATVTIPVEFENPVYVLRTSVAYYSAIPYATGTGYKLASGSGYRAATSADGAGTAVRNVSITAAQTSATTATVTVRNPNAYTVYLVNNTDQDPSDEITQGSDFLVLRGRAVVPSAAESSSDGAVTVVARNDTSITVFGEQPTSVDDSVWMQSSDAATDLAWHLAATLGIPRPVMDTVEVIANPLLQLADRVRITDTDTGLTLNRDYGIAGYRLGVSDEGLTQSIDVRELSSPLFWDSGTWDSNSWQ